MPKPRPRGRWALALAATLVPCGSYAQDAKTVPAFPSQAEAVTVDVVVVDKAGRPLRGLGQGDFTVLEDGRPQAIVSFEARDVRLPPTPSATRDAAVGLPTAAGDTDSAAEGRILGLLVDDLGLDVRGAAALPAVEAWVREKADPRDRLTLLTTSGEVEWRGQVGAGRGELLAALRRIRPRRPGADFFGRVDGDSTQPGLTDWKAYQIVSGRQSATGRLALLAKEVYAAWRDRSRAIVAAVEAFGREHAAVRGRKPLFVLTQGFIRDDDLRQADQAVDLAQRGNTPLYVIDARGLVAGDAFGDDVREVSQHLDLGGAEQAARETGGLVIRDTSGLADALARVAEEAGTYYLVGYQSARAPDGRWHKLQVKVTAKGATVRARRGYYASTRPLLETMARDAQAPAEAGTPPAQTATSPADGPRAPAPSETPRGDRAPARPAFPVQAEAVTVDVVVLDGDGRPVPDLARGEFTLLEDGRPQEIVGFEPRVLATRDPAAAAAAADEVGDRAAAAETGGRTLAFLIDDLGTAPTRMRPATDAITRWLTSGADPRDEVTVATSSGDAWWSDTVGAGRADLQAVLGRITGKKTLAAVQDAMSDWEAYSIDTFGSPGGDGEGADAPAQPPGGGGCTDALGRSVTDRVVDRWFRTNACSCIPNSIAGSIRSCRTLVRSRAREVYSAATRRASVVLGSVERVSRGLAASRGRKSVVVLSEGFLRDTQRDAFERAVDASRRGNTSVSFVDVRGLVALPFYGAEQASPPRGGDVGTMTVETTLLETAGGQYLAEMTGGSMVRDTNDLAGSVKRLADESSAYYLLGYQTDRPRDGKWHALQVKVSRPGVHVQARRGYFATAGDAAPEGKQKKKKPKGKDPQLPTRRLDAALAAGGAGGAIPLRLLPYVLESDPGGTRVVVAMEVDTTALSFSGTGSQRTAQLDVTILGVSRDQPKTVPVDSHVELSIDARAVGSWWSFSRELRLPPGTAQVRALVRDTVSGRGGLAARRVEVPRTDAPYLSSLILSDRITPAGAAGTSRLLPTAHRRFPARGYLYCAYEVYVSPGRDPKVMPHVFGSYALEGDDGRVVASGPPTPIAIALGAQLVRVHAIPLAHLPAGRYRLTVQTSDRDTGVNLEARDAFVIEPAGPAESPTN
jgi:VWFA-related protein